MIENMLFLARSENSAVIFPQWLDVDAALERIMGYFELLTEERGVSLRTQVDASAASRRVWADETMLVRALGNLVASALRHALRGTAVVLAASIHADGSCTLEVANEGTPIPVQRQSLISERFYRGDASRQGSAGGAGLGLAIVKSIMAMHHGRVSVRSAPGQPTVFSLHFPGPA